MAKSPMQTDMSWSAGGVERQPIEIETWDINRPRDYERNARIHPPEQIDELRSSLREFGQVWPILVREDETMIAGHGRREAARLEGFTKIQVVVARGWTPEQCQRFALLDNRVPENARWDDSLLRLELGEMKASGISISGLGFAVDELNTLLDLGGGLGDPDDVPLVPIAPVTRAGDLWIMGRHRLICGDATNADDTARLLNGAKPHLMVTDPPYGVDYDPSWRADANKWKGSKVKLGAKAMGLVSNDDLADWSLAWAHFLGDVAYVWHGGLRSVEQAHSLEASGFAIRSQIIWNKGRLVISRGDYHWQHEACWYAVRKGKNGRWNGSRTESTVWDIPKAQTSETGHGTQKPVECMKRPMANNSKPGDAVYDPFCGSGTTIIAAEITGRKCYALEIDPAYVDVAIQRWQTFSGEIATLAETSQSFADVAKARAVRVAEAV
jgi:DNA modification methylase